MIKIPSTIQTITPDELNRKGEQIYFDELKEKLEKSHSGDYVVIEVDSGDYFLDKDLMKVLQKARGKYKDKLFFIVQVGSLQKPTIGLKKEKNAWLF